HGPDAARAARGGRTPRRGRTASRGDRRRVAGGGVWWLLARALHRHGRHNKHGSRAAARDGRTEPPGATPRCAAAAPRRRWSLAGRLLEDDTVAVLVADRELPHPPWLRRQLPALQDDVSSTELGMQ